MFTNIYLENFKSFKQIELDLTKTKKIPKNLSVIYGGNGSGKTSVAEAFSFLSKSLKTMAYSDMLQEVMADTSKLENDAPFRADLMLELFRKTVNENQLNSICKEYKRIGTLEPTCLKYDFVLEDNKIGTYLIEFDEKQLIHERLEYALNKNKTCCYDISLDEVSVNSALFSSRNYATQLMGELARYWGKHTFLSIILKEMDEKAKSFINDNVNKNLVDIIAFFSSVSYSVKIDRDEYDEDITITNEILKNLTSGIIKAEEEATLDRIEGILSNLLSQMFEDVISTFYLKEFINSEIKYTLMFHKKTEGIEFDIAFSKESNGTKEIIRMLPHVIHATLGGVSVIDEFGGGIHEMLIEKFISSIIPEIKGQLVLITHNSLLIKTIPVESIYFIMNSDLNGKSIKCINSIESRLHPNYNYYMRYLQNELYTDAHPVIKDNIDIIPLSEAYLDILTHEANAG